MTDLWSYIRLFTAWLDAKNGRSDHEVTLRLAKLIEEAGEVVQAHLGMLGQNPRKGVTHTVDDVAEELCDVVTTALTALCSLPGLERKPEEILQERVERRAELLRHLKEAEADACP